MKHLFFKFFLFLLLICASMSFSADTQYFPPKPIYPNYGAFPHTSKLKTTVVGQGLIGRLFKDPKTGIQNFGFEFPINRNISYMSYSGLWVGGIVDGDTLVSTAVCDEIVNKTNFSFLTFIYDFHPPLIDDDTASTFLYHTEYGEIFHTTFADTFIPTYTPFSTIIDEHQPIGLQVTLKTFTKNTPPFKNIILLDFIITNKSNKTVDSTYVGMYVNEYVNGACNPEYATDDLVGSFKDEGVVYVMDNDGELNLTNCQKNKATGAMALQTMATYPPPTDTNFNWWTDNFDPRKKGTVETPYRNINYGELGAPYGDSNRYYIMSLSDWDFDQYLTKQINATDTTWITIDDSISTKISKGTNSDFLLSLGPFDLPPDSSIRTIFALFGSDIIHIDKNNYQNLLEERYDEYYSNLFFDLFFENLHFAKLLTQEYLNPLNEPLAVNQKALSSSSALLSWDNYVFPEVISYTIQLKEIPNEFLLTSTIVQPNIDFDNLSTQILEYTSETNKIRIDDLQPGKIYLARVAHKTLTSEGKFSNSIIVGANNKFIKPAVVSPSQKFVQIHPEFKLATLRWYYPDNSDIKYYKIYRAKDSASAETRYAPFLYSRPAVIPYLSQRCFDIDDSTICFYEWQAYDSVKSNIQQYTDSLTQEGFYYWITAVNNLDIESDFSPLIRATSVNAITKDIVAIIGSTDTENDFVNEDYITNYFNSLLEGYNYDLYQWTDSELVAINCSTNTCVNWEELAKYKLILVNEYPSPKILTDESETRTKLFTRLADLGHNIAYFGIPSGSNLLNLSFNFDTIFYKESSFERNYMGINNTILNPWFGTYQVFDAVDSLGGFNGALPSSQSLPVLHIKSDLTFFKPFLKQLFDFENYLPFTPAFIPTENTEILYTYQSAFPETSNLHGKPIGLLKENSNSKFFTFGFHLWAMEMQSSKELLQYLFERPSQHLPNYTIPELVTLEQNFPNPFNTTTTISFTLPDKFIVSVDVLNILGQNIKSLLHNKELASGRHRVYWDGTNEQNNEIATGIYFYRLKIRDFSFTQKMVLLK